MSNYEPTIWKAGDVVTSAKLNKLEQAVAEEDSKFFVITLSEQNSEIIKDKTFSEILSAIENDRIPIVVVEKMTFSQDNGAIMKPFVLYYNSCFRSDDLEEEASDIMFSQFVFEPNSVNLISLDINSQDDIFFSTDVLINYNSEG